jgi:IPT/TIG domain
VTNLEGTSANTPADVYTYDVPAPPAPTVTSLNPTHGTAAGGNSVTITGTDLSGATAVNFDANSASIIIATASTVVVDAPAGTAGTTAQVTVTTPGGTSPTGGSGNDYTYDPPPPPPTPDVTGLSPSHGAAAGGTTVTVFGTNFSGATVAKFGSTNATSFTVINGSKITATAPTGTAGNTVNVTVTTPSGTSSTAGTDDDYTFDIPAPTVSSLNPTHGPAAGGTLVTITGTNLTGATGVNFDANPASFTVNNPTKITATAPAGVGGTTAQVTVTTPGGTSPAKLYAYEVPATPAPVVTGLNPSHGSTAGGTSVTITGLNFTGATAVRFGITYAPSFTLDSATQITAIAPPGTAGSMVDVAVITGAGASSKTGTGNDYTYDQAPVVAQRPVPDTFLTHHPKHRTRRRQVAFAFSSDMPGVSYQCLFAQGWAKCSSPHTFRHLKPGRYRFQVKAIVNGVKDPTPASWTFRVRR